MTTVQEVDKCLGSPFLRQGQSSHTTGSPQGDDALLRSLAPNSTSSEKKSCQMLTHAHMSIIFLLEWFSHKLTEVRSQIGCVLENISPQQNSCHQMVTEQQKTDKTVVYFQFN